MNEAQLAQLMPTFGMRFLGFRHSTGIPGFAAWMVASRHPSEGRRDRTVPLADPDRVAKANADWYALATECGLFAADRRFLLSLDVSVDLAGSGGQGDEDPTLVWGLVKLLDAWDVMGEGAASRILGWGHGNPGFAMSALDGSVFVQGVVWQDSIGTAVLPHPARVASLRKVVRLNIGKPYRTDGEDEDARRWLATAAEPPESSG